ncbi:MAG TPA: hypothetical protein ENK23_06480 [Sorangium sp.]|nr:hypothetical protein [Sorangium sp.]
MRWAEGGDYVACVGELMWDLSGAPGAVFAGPLRLWGRCAGASANVARALVSAKVPTALLGQLADDVLGQALRFTLAAWGVDTSALVLKPGRCGLVFIERGTAAQVRCVAYAPQARHWLKQLPLPQRGNCRALHVGALATVGNVQLAHARLARRLRRQGALVLVDVNARPRLWQHRRLSLANKRLLSLAHVVKASREDLAVLGLSSAPGAVAAAREALGCRAATLVVTRAGQSTSAHGRWGSMRRSVPPALVVNSVGAGDAFCAGMLHALCAAEGHCWGRAGWSAALDAGHAWAHAWVSRAPADADGVAGL